MRPACKSKPNFKAFMAYSLLAWLDDLQVYLWFVEPLMTLQFPNEIFNFRSLRTRPACKSKPNFRAFNGIIIAWFVDLFFGRIYGAPISFGFYLTFNDFTISELNFQFQITVHPRPACKSEPNFRAFNGIIIACLNRRWLILLIFSNGMRRRTAFLTLRQEPLRWIDFT